MNQSHATAKTKFRPSKPLMDMLSCNLITGAVLDYGCGKGDDVVYLQSIRPGELITGYDPFYFSQLPPLMYDTIFCNKVINYIENKSDIQSMLSIIKTRLAPNGKLIIIARSIAEVRGNVNRNKNWVFNDQLQGYQSTNGIFQKGYDSFQLAELLQANGWKVYPKVGPVGVAYSYCIAKL